VPLYWVVDPEAEAVEVWTPELSSPRVSREQLTWQPPGAVEALMLGLSELFRAI
jgi:hypothetical protein